MRNYTSPAPRFRSQRIRLCVGWLLLGVLTVLHAPLRAAIALSAVTPLGASPGVTVQITGSGFAPVATNNQVVLTPSTGPAVTVSGSSIVVLDAAKDVRRLAITLPTGMPTGIASVQVRNTVSGEMAGGRSLQVIEVSVAQPVSALRGSTGVPVRLVGSPNTAFVAGRTTVIVGSGVTVTSTQVVSPTELVATVSVSATAPIGSRIITLATSTQSAQVPVGFQVVDAQPVNRNPHASANGPYSSAVAEPITFNSGGSSDPDGDALTIAWDFGDGSTSSQANPQHAYANAGTFTARLAVSDGRGGSATATATVTVTPPPNRVPSAVASAPPAANTGDPIAFSSAGSSDPDGDPLQFAWDFGDGSSAATPNPEHAYTTPGQYTAMLTVSDGRGGTSNATAVITVTTPVTLLSLVVSPSALRFSDLNATAALLVTGRFSDGSERDLTAGATGTTYTTSAPAVATAGANGVVTSVGDGGANIAIANSGVTATVPVVVEQGVALQSLELTPPIVTLRELGAAAQATVRGSFSDGSLRALTSDPGTTFSIDAAAIASVSASGLVTALAPGASTLTARSGGLSATSQVRVVVTDGSGFLRGEVFDDSKGLQLSSATATLLIGGGSAVVAPTPVPADDRGRFTLPAASGAALVRVERNGFTTVDRHADLARGSVITLLDSRLTPLDGRVNVLQSVFGGEASSTNGSAVVSVPSGSLDVDTSLRVTPISPQGLQGRLPLGWSPIAAVDLQPAGRAFTQAATLRLPHPDTLAQGTPVALAIYDAASHRWVVQLPGQVSDDRRTVAASIDRTGQFAFVVPDEAPSVPPAAIPGQALAGVAAMPVSDTATATGLVLPRSAPPGDGARAVGTVILRPPAPVSSGAVLRARVSQQFDLLDSSRIVPLQFVQDVVLYGRPRAGDAGTLAGRLPITPSLQFTIQQLSLGTVRLDVTVDEPSADSSIVGNAGGSVTDAVGNVLEVPPGALPGDVAVGLLPLSAAQLSASVPDGQTLLGAVLIDLVGASFGQPVALSIPRPTGLALNAQILVTQVITDNSGGRRLKIVGLGAISSSRVSVQTTLGSLTFEGVRGGGEFAFLQPSQPLGFITGLISAPGVGAQPLALVTTDTAPFAFLTTTAGAFVVAGRAGASTTVAAIEPSGASASGAAALAALNEIAALNLTLAQAVPVVTATIPAANATNVALDSSIVIDFSKPIDPATVTGSSVVLSAGTTPVGAQPVLSANRRRLTITPTSPLSGLTVYTLALTPDLRDAVGTGLAAFTPLRFTTLDPSKATVLALGVITAELPDEDGLSLVTGAAGAAEPNSVVVALNPRTQETVTVLSVADGSFRMHLAVVVGDEITLIFRDATGRETTISITQFTSTAGLTSIGLGGGSIQGAAGRIGRILPRALSAAGVFAIEAPQGAQPPQLPPSFVLADQFALRIEGAAFKRLESLTLTESQGRFVPATAFSAPFVATGGLTIPADFLVTASLRFTAAAVDRDGVRRSAGGATVVVAGAPDATPVDTGFGDEFPTVFVTTPRQAIPAQALAVSAAAPAARVALDLPAATAPPLDHTVMLTRLTEFGGGTKLSLVDRLTRTDVGGLPRLQTVGRELPGASRAGDYAVVSGPVAFVTGRVNGPAAMVTADGLPFVFETDGANGAFTLPVLADAPFVLRFSDAATGASLGSANGQGPQLGTTTDIGRPLAPVGSSLTASAQPDARSTVDVGAPIVFTFSAAVDRSSVTAGAFVVTDPAGVRVFGQVVVGDDGRTVTFVPSRRWRFGTLYRYGVSSNVVAASGARLSQPFAGEFTTFAPRVLGSVALGGVRDVAVSGNVGLAGTAAGVTVLDLTRPEAPAPTASLLLAGGAGGVAISTAPLVDRNGLAIPAPVAIVAAGDASSVGVVHTYGLATPASPTLLGSTQVTTPLGQTPPANVANVPGTPSAIVLNDAGRAFVATRSVGVTSIALGNAVPNNPADPGGAIAARFPATGTDSANHAALLGSNVLVAGAAGLSILDSSMQRLGTASTTGEARGVAALPAAQMDLNGDGTIHVDTEQFDAAIVANGADGTLQIFRVTNPAAPELVSVVRVPGAVEGVAVNAEDRLAYVGVGARGVALIDLSGAQGIQPIDFDRDGLDDRVLGFVDTPGSAGRLTLNLARGLGYVADGTNLSVVQLLPARTRFETLMRDVVGGVTGDEESILASREAFTTDAAILVTLHAAIPPRTDLFLRLDELTEGTALTSFPDGSASVRLVDGVNTLTIPIAGNASSTGGQVRLLVTTGATDIAGLVVRLTPPPVAGSAIQSMFITPQRLDLNDAARTGQLGVGGVLNNGRTVNLTSPSTGTTYRSADDRIASVDAAGMVTAVAGGRVDVLVTNGDQTALAAVRVDAPGAVASLETPRPRVTLTSLGQSQPLQLEAIFTDGLSVRTLRGLVTFSTSNAAVVTVDADGVLTAVGPGTAIITARVGDLVQQFSLTVEPRLPANLTGIEIQPLAAPVRSDDTEARARVVVSGTGSLEGLTVTSSVGLRQLRGTTDYAGVVLVPLPGLVVPGPNQLTVSVINPATGQPLIDTETVTVERAGQDAEPNDEPASAIPVRVNRRLSGTVGGGDLRDAFRIDVPAAGTLSASFVFGPATVLADVRVVFFDANGAELSRRAPLQLEQRLSQAVAAGVNRIAIETTGSPVSYALEARFVQAPITIIAVTPPSGAAGTPVSITGTGFSTDLAGTHVLFGGIRGKVTSVSTTRIEVAVPSAAVDGALRVISGEQQVTGPIFVVGNAQPRPLAMLLPHDEADVRFDPISGVEVIVNRLTVYLDPTLPRSVAETLATAVGAAIVGVNAVQNSYTLFFSQNRTLAGLDALRRQLAGDSRVVLIVRETLAKVQQVGRIDSRDATFLFSGTVPGGVAYDSIGLFDAIEAIRGAPGFETTVALRPVHVGVIDTGFKPFLNFDFMFNGAPLVDFFKSDPVTGLFAASAPADGHGHGTAVTSVIMARNNGNQISGVLGSLYQQNETPRMKATVYGHGLAAGSFSRAFLDQALSDLSNIADLDVLNISIAMEATQIDDDFLSEQNAYRFGLGLFTGRTLITIAAGNFGRQVRMSLPASLSTEFAHVISVGGTAVADLDQTNEQEDARAVFTGSELVDITDIPDLVCLAIETITETSLFGTPRTFARGLKGSSCGAELTIVAPAEDVLVAVHHNAALGKQSGTSFAAPMVAGAAALLQAIRGNRPAFTAVELRNMLVDTADNISGRFDPGDARKLNLLAAVRALLPAAVPQAVYIADQELETGDPDSRGAVVAIQVDPLTGLREPTVLDAIIPLTVQGPTEDFVTRRPTELIAAPSGDKVYAVVQTNEPTIGDGLLVISTQSHRPRKFIAFNGMTFPASGAPPPTSGPVFAGSLRPGNAFSKDGRLLYVGTGQTITIINTVEDKVVRSFADLPASYRTLAGSAAGTLNARLQAISGLIQNGIASSAGARGGVSITGLDVSPFSDVLYVAVNTGGGGGQQPGGLLAIDINLYLDALPEDRGLQSDLENYFTPITPQVVPMVGAGRFAGGDEPGAVVADPGGEHVYLMNGGLNFFESLPPDSLDLTRYFFLLGGPLLGTVGISGGLAGLAVAEAALANLATNLFNELVLDIRLQAQSGLTLVGAPGFTGVYNSSGPSQSSAPQWQFPSDVVFGQSPDPAAGGVVVNQFRFRHVFGKRPFDIAINPSGRRAIVPLFQTGNFAVLDRDAQATLEQSMAGRPIPNPNLPSLPDTMFKAVFGVTEALRLDNHAWPARGAFSRPGEPALPSPDENLLFPWRIEYAQNGRFAVATHVGVGTPRDVTTIVPPFDLNPNDLLAFLSLGYQRNGNTQLVALDPSLQPPTLTAGAAATFERGGGAVSFIDDRAIATDISAHATQSVVGENGLQRPYYSANPICREPAPGGLPTCASSPVTSIVKYADSGGPTRIHRPRGVAIQPFIYVEEPRFGDRFTLTQTMHPGWRDRRTAAIEVTIDSADDPNFTTTSTFVIFSDEVARGTKPLPFASMFANSLPTQGHYYQFFLRLKAPDGTIISSTALSLQYDDPGGEPVEQPGEGEITLSPKLSLFVTVPSTTPRQLTVSLQAGDSSPPSNITRQVNFRWIGNGLLPGSVDGLNEALNYIRDKLSDEGVPVPFQFGDVTIDTNGLMSVVTAGLQAVQACRGSCSDAANRSNISIVLAGLEVDSIDVEAKSLISAGADNLLDRIQQVNTPLIVTARNTNFVTNKGVIYLDDVHFKYLGQGEISVRDLSEAVKRALGLLAVLGPQGAAAGRAATKVIEFAQLASQVIGSAALTFRSADSQIAAAGCPSFVPFFEGCISGVAPGITAITAELDLTALGLGKGDDTVLTWVLPRIDSAQLEPPSLTMCTADPTLPGKSVRTFGTVEAIQQAVISIPEGYQDAAAFIERTLPPSWLTLGTAGRFFTFADGFKVFVSFGVTMGADAVTISNARFGFHMPRFFTDYTAPSPIADVGIENLFDTFIEHQGIAGVGQLLSEASIPLLGSATASGTVTVNDCTAALSLRPVLIPIVEVPSGDIPLRAFQTTAQGEEDVTSGRGTRYFSLSQPIPNEEGPIAEALANQLRQLADQAVQELNTLLTQQGVPIQFARATTTIDQDTGVLTVQSAGVEVIFARNGEQFSNPSVVLAGIELDSISLGPRSAINLAANELIERMNKAFEFEINRPLVLIDAQPAATLSFAARHGLVVLEDVAFKYLGAGRISVKQLVEKLGNLISGPLNRRVGSLLGNSGGNAGSAGAGSGTGSGPPIPIPQRVLVKAVLELMQFAVQFGGAQFLQFGMEDLNVATVTNFNASVTDPSLGGVVTEEQAGITAVTGTLTLDTPFANLGEKSDSVSVWVLPGLATGEIIPRDTIIHRSSDPNAGPTIKTNVCTADFPFGTVIEVPAEYASDAEFLDAILPASWHQGSVDQMDSFGDFDFRVRATFSFSAAGIAIDAASICFTVSNGIGGEGDDTGIPGVVSNDYFFVNPATLVPDSTIVALGPVDPFSVRLRHQNRVGEVRVDNRVDFTVLGEVNAVGSVKVVDTAGSVYVEKVLEDPGPHATVVSGQVHLAPGDAVTYRVIVAHVLGDDPVENIPLFDTAELHVPVGGGQFQPQALQQTPVPLFTLQPGEQREFVFTIVVPASAPVGSKLVNAACIGSDCDSVETPILSDPDIALTKVLFAVIPPGGPVLAPGATVRYRVTITNNGTAAKEGLTITDRAALEGIGPSGQPGRIAFLPLQTCAIVRLDPQETEDCFFEYVLPASANLRQVLMNNEAVVIGVAPVTTSDPVSYGSLVTVTKELIIPAGGAAAIVTPDTQVTYRVTVRNDGDAASESMILSDAATIGGVPIRCQTNSTTFVCGSFIGSLDPGEVVTREFRFRVADNTAGQTLRNTARVDIPGVAEAVVEHVVRQRSLAITKELISPQPAAPGGTAVILAGSTAVYRVTVTNNGSAVANNVVLNDQPSISQGTSAVSLTNQLFNLGDILPGQTVIQEPIEVPVDASFGGRILANVASVINIPDVPIAQVSHQVVAASLVIEKVVVDPPGGYAARLIGGSPVTYEVTVRNTGGAAAPAQVLTDRAYVSGVGGYFFDRAIAVGPVGAGQTVAQQITFIVPQASGVRPACPPGVGCAVQTRRIINEAHLFSATPIISTGIANDVIDPTLDVALALVDPVGTTVLGGSTASYEVRATNSSAVPARQVRITALARTGGFILLDRLLEMGDIAPGQTRVQRVSVLIPRGFDGQTLVHTAEANYLQTAASRVERPIVDPDIRVSVTLLAGPGVIATGGRSVVLAGQTVGYRVVVQNLGITAVQNLTLENEAFLDVFDPLGNLVRTSLGPTTLVIPSVPGLGTFTTTFQVAVPADAIGKQVVDRAALLQAGVGPALVEHPVITLDPTAGLVITELVLAPMSDWNDSSGGNQQSFDATPGDGAINADDIWVEVLRPTSATNLWRIVLIDATGQARGLTLAAASGSGPVQVLSGFGAFAGPIVTVEVRDDQDAVRQTVDVLAISGILGPATSSGSESLSWSSRGFPSSVLQQFVRRPATIGVFSPF